MGLPFQPTWILPIILACSSLCLASLNVTYGWKYIEYIKESCGDQKAYAVAMKSYNYTKIIPISVQPLPDGRVMVTTPRYFNNPASLSTISDQTGNGGPLLAPYPNWTWHNRKDCSGITSVNRVFLDNCNRLWLVDSGKIGSKMVCPAKILAFDPEKDELIKELLIPDELTHNAKNKSQGRLEVSEVETYGKSCEKTWVYIADPEGYGLVIWDGYDIWRLNDAVFDPHPNATTFSIAGENFTLNIGLSSMYITPEGYLKNRAVLFKSMSAVNGYGVNLDDLHNSKFGCNITFYKPDFTQPSQELAGAYSEKGGILIVGFTTETALACWNLQYPLETANVGFAEVNETTLQFISGVKITENSKSGLQTLWVLTNKLQHFILGTMNWTEINYRILTDDIDTLVNGTVCEPLKEYDVKYDIEDKGFLYYKTSTKALLKSYRLHHATDTSENVSVWKLLEKCDVENGITEVKEETPSDAPSKSCRLIRK